MIICIYGGKPTCTPQEQHPNAIRMSWIGATRTWVVDYIDNEPTSEEIRQAVEPTQAELNARQLTVSRAQAKAKAFDKLDPQTKAMRVAIRLLLQKLNATLPVIQRTTWPQFMQQWKALIDNETDPET